MRRDAAVCLTMLNIQFVSLSQFISLCIMRIQMLSLKKSADCYDAASNYAVLCDGGNNPSRYHNLIQTLTSNRLYTVVNK